MAYKQSPGRMAMAKTGRGISPTLMGKCGSPMKQTKDPDLTREGAESRKKVLAGATKRSAGSKTDSQGIKVDPTTGKAGAKAYEKKYKAGKPGQKDRVLDSKGKIVKEAKTPTKSGEKNNAELRKEFVRDSTNTMNSRNRNARFYNVQAGKEKPTAAETRSGQGRGFFAK
jgi:hypothetical protein